MKTFFLSLFIVFITISISNGQVIENPQYKSADDPTTVITKVERNAKFTILTFEHSQTGEGWISLSKSIYLQNHHGDEVYKFIKAEGIPLSPAKKSLKGNEGKFSFKVYFEKVPASVKSINVIERALPKNEPGNYFNYFEVVLDKKAKAKEDNLQRI
jgi:hypothetical protein